MSSYDIHDTKQHFITPNHVKKVKFLDFGIKNANLAALRCTGRFQSLRADCSIVNLCYVTMTWKQEVAQR